MKKAVVINAGPRKGWNTDLILKSMQKGAEDGGYQTEYIDLYKLEKYTGCVSCFGCKLPKTFGTCVCHDGLYEVLNKIREADALFIGSPNYLGDMTANFRALFERLVFQSLTYNKEKPNCNEHLIPVVLVMTSNCSEDFYDAMGYTQMLERYKKTLSAYVGPTTVFTCGDTLQVNDYSKYDWTMFNPEAKKARREETFDSYLEKAYEIGKNI